MNGILPTLLFFLFIPRALAVDSLSLGVASIDAQGWTLRGIHAGLTGISGKQQALILIIDSLSFHKPFDDLNLVNVRCHDFGWKHNELWCRRGRAEIRSRSWQSPSANFAFHIGEQKASFELTDLRFLDGRFSLKAVEQGRQWQVVLKGKGLNVPQFQKLLTPASLEIGKGAINLDLEATGSQTQINSIHLSAEAEGLSLHTQDGKIATESLSLFTSLQAQDRRGIWHWRGQSRLTGGGLYVDPVYLDAEGQSVSLEAEGEWNGRNKQADIRSVRYVHANTGEVTGQASVQLDGGLRLNEATLSLRSDDMERLASIYLKPFLEQTSWDGLELKGQLYADVTAARQSLKAVSAVFNNLELLDSRERFAVSGGSGTVNWSDAKEFDRPSTLAWRQLQLGAVPMGAARLSFLTRTDTIRLLEKTRIPLFGGAFSIKRFDWQGGNGQDPSVFFDGNLNQVSLEQLSLALGWTPLSGTVSGAIPGVEYSHQTLKVGGELLVRVFDGIVKVGSLALSDVFTDLPVLTAEIEMDNLDMDQITRHFEFGGITGRLSGYVKNLVLENWKPVSFYAWLGTPEDDDSSHRISQKAVKNIASIGGGGASDLISRSVLSFFETFGYDKLGIGCYLHDGVCQLMGLEATSTGYYIIKGGGLPRIDVIGYNSRIDWEVLIERLKRITASDDVIIE
ncbi:MAG: C4-dicarboxylate ABC transporter [Gammaproteobacteria bacterium]